MRYKINIKLLISGLIFSSFAFAGNQSASLEDIDSNACLDNKACSKMLEISLVNPIKNENTTHKKTSNDISAKSIEVAYPILIKNKSKRSLSTVISATHNSNKVNCGRFTAPAKASITAEIACNIGGVPYSLSDSDGRSNVIKISGSTPTPADPNSCVGKSIDDECRGGIIFKTDGVNGLIVSKPQFDLSNN
tara:strand:+ start:158 stop:733 length:576 start_codon:yes stop_codon:yes gene_type:complete